MNFVYYPSRRESFDKLLEITQVFIPISLTDKLMLT